MMPKSHPLSDTQTPRRIGGLTYKQISAYNAPMRRKPGTLIPIEQAILVAAMHLQSRGDEEFHGFQIAKEIKGHGDARRLTGHGTLYRALGRLKQQGYLDSRWEDTIVATRESRPHRKLYRLTTSGTKVAATLTSSIGKGSLKLAWATMG